MDPGRRYLGPLKETHKEELFRGFGQAFGTRKRELFQSIFHWKYEESRFQKGTETNWLVHSGEKFIGHIGGLPVQMKIGSQTTSAKWVVDWFVDPARKGRNAFRLLEHLLDGAPLAIYYNTVKEAKRILIFYNFKCYPVPPTLVKPVGWFSSCFRGSQPFDFHVQNSLTEEHLGFISRTVRRFPVHVVRDERYLSWRYFTPPNRSRIIELRQNHQLLALAIVEKVRWRNFRCGIISELFAKNWDKRAIAWLIEAVEIHFKFERVQRVVTEGFPPFVRTVFLSRGYRVKNDQNTFGFLDPQHRYDATLLSNPDNWLLTPGDCDRFFGYSRLPWRQ